MAFLKKLTVQLILWSIFSNTSCVENLSNNLYHIEGLYWFLFSLWIMNVIFTCVCLFFRRKADKRVGYCICVIIYSMILVLMLLVASYFTVCVDFLGAKYTVYFFPFILLGWFGSELTKKAGWRMN